MTIVCLAAIASSCVSLSEVERTAIEFVVPQPGALARRAIGDEILVEQSTIDAMRAVVSKRGENLVGVVHLHLGVHPYSVLAFIESTDGSKFVATVMYWGSVQAKWAGTVSPAEFQGIVNTASALFDCSDGAIDDSAFGAVLVHWPSGAQVTCEGGWLTEESLKLAEKVSPLLDASRNTYERPQGGGF